MGSVYHAVSTLEKHTVPPRPLVFVVESSPFAVTAFPLTHIMRRHLPSGPTVSFLTETLFQTQPDPECCQFSIRVLRQFQFCFSKNNVGE